MKKPFPCRIGFHSIYSDYIMEPLVSGGKTYIFNKEVWHKCNYCNYSKRIL